MNQDTFHTILSGLLDDVYAAVAPKPERKCVVPGLVAWDACECGALHGTISRWGVSDNQASLNAPPVAGCSLSYQVATLTISLVRCVPIPTERQLTVPCAKLEEAAIQLERDAYQVMETVVCSLNGLIGDTIENWQLIQMTPAGPEGQCAGVVLQVNVWVPR